MAQGEYRIFDAHCHIFPEKIAAAAVGGTAAFYGAASFGTGTPEDLLRQADRAGIDRCLVHSVATKPEQVRSINRFLSEETAKSPDRFFGFGTMHPASGDIRGDLMQLADLGLHGIKIHPDIQGFRADDPRFLKIYEECGKAGLPVLMHCGDARYDNSNPERIRRILEAFPGVTFIGAHLGGWSVWEDAAEQLSGKANFFVDCSSSFPYLTKQTSVRLLRLYGADKVLFGTDYPMWDPKEQVGLFLQLGLTEKEQRMILYENAENLFRIID